MGWNGERERGERKACMRGECEGLMGCRKGLKEGFRQEVEEVERKKTGCKEKKKIKKTCRREGSNGALSG